MKFMLVLSAIALAAFGAPSPQPVSLNPVALGPFGDVTIGSANVPHDTVDTLTTFAMNVGLGNRGTKADSGRVSIVIADTAVLQVVYAESVYFRIGAGTALRVDFPETRFTTLGPRHGVVRLWTYRRSRDSLKWDFWVMSGLGVEETPNAECRMPNLGPTVLSGAEVQSLASKVVFDALGRRVLNAKSGVLFVAEYSVVSSQHSGTEHCARNTVHVRKVILQR